MVIWEEWRVFFLAEKMNPTALGLGITCPSSHSLMSSQVCNELYIPQLEHDVKVVMVLDK